VCPTLPPMVLKGGVSQFFRGKSLRTSSSSLLLRIRVPYYLFLICFFLGVLPPPFFCDLVPTFSPTWKPLGIRCFFFSNPLLGRLFSPSPFLPTHGQGFALSLSPPPPQSPPPLWQKPFPFFPKGTNSCSVFDAYHSFSIL